MSPRRRTKSGLPKTAPPRTALERSAGSIPGRFFAPQPIERLAFIRIFAPLAVLGFMSLRMIHAGDWLSVEGFSVPDLGGGDWRQPLYLPPLPVWGAWGVCSLMVLSGLSLSMGYRTRQAAAVFAACIIYVTLADRLSAFTVNKLGAALVLALFFTPSGAAYSLDAYLKRGQGTAPTLVTWGNVRFFQALLVIMYFLTGVAKWTGDWLTEPLVLWSHLHGSYQTWISYFISRSLPLEVWPLLRWVVLGFELLAPLLFVLPWARLPALFIGLGMHLFIGLCFGPVVWFALLMGVLLIGCFAPVPWLRAFLGSPVRSCRSRGGSVGSGCG